MCLPSVLTNEIVSERPRHALPGFDPTKPGRKNASPTRYNSAHGSDKRVDACLPNLTGVCGRLQRLRQGRQRSRHAGSQRGYFLLPRVSLTPDLAALSRCSAMVLALG